MPLDLIVCGVGGRMGGAMVRAIQQTRGVKLIAAIDKPGSARLGKDAGEISAAGRLDVEVADEIGSYLIPNRVIIDFTNAEASLAYLRNAAKKKVPMVIGTTGWHQHEETMKERETTDEKPAGGNSRPTICSASLQSAEDVGFEPTVP